jgi:hypothetical protein
VLVMEEHVLMERHGSGSRFNMHLRTQRRWPRMPGGCRAGLSAWTPAWTLTSGVSMSHLPAAFLLPPQFIPITSRPLIREKRIQFSYCTIHFIPSCGIKFIHFWSVVCAYKSFKFICFRCCGNCVGNWIPKCLFDFKAMIKSQST